MLPKMGNILPNNSEDLALAGTVAAALDTELGRTHQAVKTVMRWTGASERTVKLWLAGAHVPRGIHLVRLMRNSDNVLKHILIASGRESVQVGVELAALRITLKGILTLVDQIIDVDATSRRNGAVLDG